jgi:hypothetical protein
MTDGTKQTIAKYIWRHWIPVLLWFVVVGGYIYLFHR